MSRSVLAIAVALALPVAADAADPQFEARFVDGSVMVVSVIEPTLVFKTRYGKLTIPLVDVRTIDLGFRYPAGMEPKVRAAVEELGSADYKVREDAQKRLLLCGEFAVPAVREGARSKTPEVAERCSQILKVLAERLPSEKLDPRDEDVIGTDELTVRGTIDTPTLRVKSRYFGEATVKLVDLTAFRPRGSTAEGVFTLDAGKYAKQGWAGWYDTNLEVRKDQPIEIRVSGKIDQWSQEPGRYTAGPDGTAAQVPGPPGMGGQVEHLGGRGLPPPGGPGLQFQPGGFVGMLCQSGAVYGRIGAKGTPFKIGSRWEQASAPAAGKLYLIIAPSNWGNDSAGEYRVTVKLGG